MNQKKSKELLAFFAEHTGFIKFCVVGASNTGISLVIYWILVSFHIHYLLASTLGYLAGILNGYILSSKFVFNAKNDMHSMIKFVSVYLSSLLINLTLLYILVNNMELNKLIAQVFVIGVNTVYNYMMNKIWTFRQKGI